MSHFIMALQNGSFGRKNNQDQSFIKQLSFGQGAEGAVAQSVERVTPGEEDLGLIPYWLGRCQLNGTG